MTEEIPSARPTFPQPTPAENIPADAPSLVPAAAPAAPATPQFESVAGTILPDSIKTARSILSQSEDVLLFHHQNPEYVAATANHERLASALVLVQQARDRFEEWVSATF
jgi:hypothetical protein